MKLGLHNGNFTWADHGQPLFSTLKEIARRAEAGDIARFTVMDHLWQIPNYGPPENEMLEAYSTLGFLAANTKKMLLHTLVTGVVYRQPGLLAKQVTTLNVLSDGRVGLGIGSAWNETEANGLGLPFPSVAERFERLEEAIQICLQMWSGSDAPYRGQHYDLERTLNSPAAASLPHPYLLIGGGGEKKTLRMVAQYADACNIFATPESHLKLEVLQRHCDAVNRDYGEIEKTALMYVVPSTTKSSLLESLASLQSQGFAVVYIAGQNPDPFQTVDLIASITSEVAGWDS